MTDVILFQAVTAVTLLGLKLGLKGYVRWLASNDGMTVVADGVQGFGMDLAILGFSLILGGVATKGIKLDGQGDALALIAFIVCFIVAFLCYGGINKAETSVGKWVVGSLSWLFGLVPYSGGIVFLTTR